MESWWWKIPFVLVAGIELLRLFHRKAVEAEFERNEKFAPPSARQLRWHIRHTREDIMVLVKLGYINAVLLLGILLGS